MKGQSTRLKFSETRFTAIISYLFHVPAPLVQIVFLVKDQATRVAGSYPVKSKGHVEAKDALLNVCDDVVKNTLRSDNSRELIAPGIGLRQYLTVSLSHSVPHRPQSNSIIERWGQ